MSREGSNLEAQRNHFRGGVSVEKRKFGAKEGAAGRSRTLFRPGGKNV